MSDDPNYKAYREAQAKRTIDFWLIFWGVGVGVATILAVLCVIIVTGRPPPIIMAAPLVPAVASVYAGIGILVLGRR